MLTIEFSRLAIMIPAASGALITAGAILAGFVATPLAMLATFATSFAAVFGVITVGVNVAISRMDLASNVLDTEELEQLNALQLREWQHRQALTPGQHVDQFLQREIAAGNPMWTFMAPKPPTAQSPSDPKTAPDIEGYMVGGHNLRKRKN